MSLDDATPFQSHPINGIGPYGLPWPYRADTLRVSVVDTDGSEVVLSGVIVDPPEAAESGNVFLTLPDATDYDGLTLYIARETPPEQGWEGLQGARERGLTAQLDQIVMTLQELLFGVRRSLRTTVAVPVFIPTRPGTAIIWSGTGFISGPTADEIENAQQYAEDAAAALAAMDGRYFRTRAEAEAARIPAPVGVITVVHGGHVLRYMRSDTEAVALQTADGQRWIPAEGSPIYTQHYGVLPAARPIEAITDYTAEMQAACRWTVGQLLFTGWVRVEDQIKGNRWMTPHSVKGRNFGGFAIFSTFNLDAESVFIPWDTSDTSQQGIGAQSGQMGDLGWWFQQSVAEVTGLRSDLVQYPWALDLSKFSSRYRIGNIRIEGAWNGVNAAGLEGGVAGNPGGAKWGILEIGAFNTGLDLDWAYDFVDIDTLHFWPFGAAAVPNLLAIYTDGTTVGPRIGRTDGLKVKALSCFECKAIVSPTEPSIIPMQFSAITMDGGRGIFEWHGGDGEIASYSCHAYSRFTGGRVTMAGGRFSGQATPMCLVSGTGVLHLNGTGFKIWHPNPPAIRVEQQGQVYIDGIMIEGPAAPRLGPAIIVDGPDAVIQITGLKTKSLGATVPILTISHDNAGHRVDLSNLRYYTTTIPLNATQGMYRLPPWSAAPEELRFSTRATLAGYIASGQRVPVGQIVRVGALQWQYDGVSTAIADMLGWVPADARASVAVWGVTGSGLVDDLPRLTAAVASGWPLHARGLLVGVSGIFAPPAGADIEDLRLKQLAPGSSVNARTLQTVDRDGMRLVRVAVDRNGDGTNGGLLAGLGVNGALNTAFGIIIVGGKHHHLEDLEVYGDDSGTGICLRRLDHTSRVIRPNVHDMRWVRATGSDDMVQGLWLDENKGLVVEAPNIGELTGVLAGVPTLRYTRAIAWGGNTALRMEAPNVYRCDQGVDLTGSNGNIGCTVRDGYAFECATWGFKLANTAQRNLVERCVSERCGVGFVASGQPAVAEALRTNFNRFVDCIAYDCGAMGGTPVGIAGFRVLGETLDAAGMNSEFIRCTAHDRQAVKTMVYGFMSEAPASVAPFAKDCVSIGHITGDFQGVWKRPRSGSNANGSYTIDDNGVMECWHTVVETAAYDTAAGALYIRDGGGVDWTFPVEFADVPVVTAGMQVPGNWPTWAIPRSEPTATEVSFLPASAFTLSTSITKRLMLRAVGRAW